MAIQKKAPAVPARAAKAATPINRGNAAGPAPAQDQRQFASLNPEDFTAGGLLDDVDVTFETCRFVEWDYNGNIDHPVLALLVTMNYQDVDGKAATADQYYSAGELTRFYPSEDGCHAVPAAGGKGLAAGTNAATFVKSVIDQGFPVDRFGDGDVSAMDGLVCHINRVAQQKRGGAITGKTTGGYEATVAVVTKIHKMPWETSAASAAPAKGPARPTSTAATARPAAARGTAAQTAQVAPPNGAAQDMDLQEEAAGILIAVLDAKGGSVQKMGIAPASFKLLSGNPNRSGILNLLSSDDFLALDDYGWAFDGKTVSAVG